jgi:small-conductance mechanosensitive channel
VTIRSRSFADDDGGQKRATQRARAAMLGGIETAILIVAATLAGCGFVFRLRLYRSLLWGGAVLATLTALYPRPNNGLAMMLYGGAPRVRSTQFDLFGIAWWILGAWLIKGLLNLILRRTIFPNDDQPHARRLFADLASGFVYVVAFVGIMDTVLKEPISTVVATSGVLAIVLGLALQNTLADVFSGLAINIERPFGAGDWITLPGEVEGQVMEINWRATRIRTLANDTVVVPNSVVAKGIVTNHRPLNAPNICKIGVKVDQGIAPPRVIAALKAAAADAAGTAAGSAPAAYATSFDDTLIVYELWFAIVDFSQTALVRSEVISRVAEATQRLSMPFGNQETAVRILRDAPAVPAGEPLKCSDASRAPPSA